MKITEVVTPDPSYFMQEGCAIFALVLHKLIGGSFYIYTDAGPTADRWQSSGHEYTHVLLGIGRAFYDVRGVRTLPDLAQEFHKNPDDMRLLGPFTEQEFRRRFVGPSDRQPFYPPTPDLVAQAETIIRSNPNTYRVGFNPNAGFNPRPWLTGKCFDFALALHERMPDAEFVTVGNMGALGADHVGLRRNGVYYDVRGAFHDVQKFLAHHIRDWTGDPAKLVEPISRDFVELHAGVAGVAPPYRGNRDIAAARQAVTAVFGKSRRITEASQNYPASVDTAYVVNLVRRIHSRPEDFNGGNIENRIWRFLRYELRPLPVATLHAQSYWDIDDNKVAQYAGMPAATMPPIVYDPIEDSIIDGTHRVETAAQRNDQTILAYVGTDPDPHWVEDEDDEYN